MPPLRGLVGLKDIRNKILQKGKVKLSELQRSEIFIVKDFRTWQKAPGERYIYDKWITRLYLGLNTESCSGHYNLERRKLSALNFNSVSSVEFNIF